MIEKIWQYGQFLNLHLSWSVMLQALKILYSYRLATIQESLLHDRVESAYTLGSSTKQVLAIYFVLQQLATSYIVAIAKCA